MKKLILPSLLFSASLGILCAGCYSSKTVVSPSPAPPPPVVVVEKKESHLPPGQAKKIYGEKSAKDFAPGQQKKQVNKSYPLIIVINTGMKVIVTSDGRRCYKNDQEVVYWEGFDGRYYVDNDNLPDQYDKKEYDDWNKNKGQGMANKGKDKKNGKGKKDHDDD